jgi:hypothetical protein
VVGVEFTLPGLTVAALIEKHEPRFALHGSALIAKRFQRERIAVHEDNGQWHIGLINFDMQQDTVTCHHGALCTSHRGSFTDERSACDTAKNGSLGNHSERSTRGKRTGSGSAMSDRAKSR